MIEKSCHSLLTSGVDFFSFHRGNELIKEASYLDEPVEKFAKKISAEDGYSWILLHAIGSGEYYDSNRNGDIFYEKSLCHVPPNWSGDPEIDRIIAKTWDYGYPTFYNGHLYAQHINKDPEKALGVIEFVHWNKHMHRVELVIKISHKRAGEFGGDWALRRLDKGDLLDASMGTRVAYDLCLKKGTWITTIDGYKPVEEIKEGDKVLTSGGAFQRVLTVFKSPLGDRKWVKIYTHSKLPLVVTDNHPVACLDNNFKLTYPGLRKDRKKLPFWNIQERYVLAGNLQVGDCVIHPKLTKAQSVWPLEFYRLGGYYLAEGWIIRQRRGRKRKGPYRIAGVSWSFHIDEIMYREEIKSLLKRGGYNPPREYLYPNKKEGKLICHDMGLAHDLLSVFGEKSREKYISPELLNAPNSHIAAMVGAYLNGDGSLTQGGGIQATTASQKLAYGLIAALMHLDIHANLYADTSIRQWAPENSVYWQLQITGSDCAPLYPWCVFQGNKSHRKHNSVYKNRLIKKIQKLEIEVGDSKEETYNLQIEKDPTFVANNILVHNCIPDADYEAHNRALATFDSKIHKSPAHAVLMYHKMHPITGLSVTKDDYTDLGKHSINKVFPDGKKVMLDNTFPRFFDISFVFIGAEKPAKVMYKFASGASKNDVRYERVCIGDHCESFVPSGAVMYELEKTASKSSQKSASVKKESDISKEVGSTFNPRAIGKHCDDFEDLPKHVLDSMGKSELDESLSTSGLSGVILKPKEFQRVVLIKLKMSDMADKLDENAQVFSPTDRVDSVPSISHDSFNGGLFSALKDFLPLRSVLSPFTGIPAKVRNITIISIKKPTPVKNEVLDKIAASYNGYRKALYEHFQKEASLAISQNLLLRNELFKYGSEGNFISNDTIRLLREF